MFRLNEYEASFSAHEVVSLTAEEKTYVLGQTTNTWLELSQKEKDEDTEWLCN